MRFIIYLYPLYFLLLGICLCCQLFIIANTRILVWLITCSTSIALVYRALVYRALVYRALVYRALVYRALVYRALVYRALVYRALVYRALVYRALVYRALVYRALVYRALVYRARVCCSVWWPGVNKHVAEIVRHCAVCAQ